MIRNLMKRLVFRLSIAANIRFFIFIEIISNLSQLSSNNIGEPARLAFDCVLIFALDHHPGKIFRTRVSQE